MSAIEDLCARAAAPAHVQRVTSHILAQLACLGTHTVTGLLNTCGRQFGDWSADYRLYEKDRVDPQVLFQPVREELLRQPGPIVCALDDTRLTKTGRKIHGVKYMRDSMGPRFRANFVLAQRFLQTSMALKACGGQARMVPVDWVHAPVPAKPGANASQEAWDTYRREQKHCRISEVGARRIRHLRQWLDGHDAENRALWTVADGSFTNGTVFRQLPANTTFVGRIRADAKLYHLPRQQPRAQGRRRVYGDLAPTPKQLHQDQNVPWQEVQAFFGGEKRTLRVKQLKPLRWRTAGAQHDLQLLVIAPTRYRLSKNSKCLYRSPAYLICTDVHASLNEIIQHYLWRWDIEVNFRDEKTLLGLGDAKVRTPAAVQNVTALAVAAYAMLHTAAENCQKQGHALQCLPSPKWNQRKNTRITTMNLLNILRHELWADAIHCSGFKAMQDAKPKSKKSIPALESALFYTSTHS